MYSTKPHVQNKTDSKPPAWSVAQTKPAFYELQLRAMTCSDLLRHRQKCRWSRVQNLNNYNALYSLMQFCWSGAASHSLYPHMPNGWFAAVAVGAAAVLGANHWLRHASAQHVKLQQLQLDWPAWSATLLLILQALQQLVSCGSLGQHTYNVVNTVPASAALPCGLLVASLDGSVCQCLQCACIEPAFCPLQASWWVLVLFLQVQLALQYNQEASVSVLVLLVITNGLMVPRALYTKQFMWFTGTCSGTMLALGQLAVLTAHAFSRHFQQKLVSPFTGLGSCSPWGLTASRCTSEAVALPGLGMGVLLAWLMFSAAVLQWGWRYIQSTQS